MNDVKVTLALIFILTGAVAFVAFRMGMLFQIMKNNRSKNFVEPPRPIKRIPEAVEDVRKN